MQFIERKSIKISLKVPTDTVNKSVLIQLMASHLFSIKPLAAPMMTQLTDT